MNSHPAAFDPELLLSHSSWVRALAKSMVPADAHLADDVAQAACIAALEHRPSSERPLRGWFAEVVRNFVRQERRGALRRLAREERAARPEALPSTLDLVERLSVHREVVDAVTALEEPYRTTVLLRYFEGLPPAEVARLQAVPVATVKTRLARALEKLRKELDARHGGDGRTWLLALIPLSRPSGAASATTLGALVVSTNLKIALVGVALVSGALFVWRMQSPVEIPVVQAQSDPLRAPALQRSSEPAAPAPLVVSETESARVAAAPARTPDPAPTKPAAVATEARVRGRVLDLDARPVGGVGVAFERGRLPVSKSELALADPEGEEPTRFTAVSDGQGRFEMDVPPAMGELAVREERYATVLAGTYVPGATESEPVIVVAPRIQLAGRVIDESGRPLASARVVLALPEHFRTHFADILDYSAERGFATTTDASGAFDFARAPLLPEATLHARLDGYLGHVQPLPASSDRAIEIVLARQQAEPGVVSGQVVDERGALVPAARVALGDATTQTDEQGRFALKVEERSGELTLTAVKRGHLPATRTIDVGADFVEFVVLKLGPPPLAIEGRVIDTHGEPQAGIKVWATAPTPFGDVDDMPASIEALLAGAPTRADLEQLLARAGEGVDPRQLFRDTPTVFWNFAMTGADGRFRMEGLLERDYDLDVMDRATLLRVKVPAVSAGRSDVLITIPAGLVHERVAGHVISRSGRPLAGVTVAPMCDVISLARSRGRSTMHAQADSVRTDKDGYFEILKFPRQEVYLRLDGESILPIEFGRGAPLGIESVAKQKLHELELVVATRLHVQVELAPEKADTADELQILDRDDSPLDINVFMGNSRNTTERSPIVAGRSHVMVVTEEAATLVLLKGEKEVGRVGLALVPGELNVVRP